MKYKGSLTLRNDFHNTATTVKVNDGFVSASAMKRAEKKLCGMKDCQCGNIRGRQDARVEFNQDGSAWVYAGE